jgi:hypothetical protein
MAKKAVVVGINQYANANGLRGCVNDAIDMHLLLRTAFGFQSKDIRVVTDDRATKEGILRRLRWLVRGAQAGDALIFHYSGHGSQIRDRDGDELTDHLDELICPHDMDWDGTYITDDDLHKIFSGLPAGVLLEVFLDSCHSGTGLRDLGLQPPPELAPPPQLRNRFLPPPVDIQLRLTGEEDQVKLTKLMGRAGGPVKNQILWAGCKDNQTSADDLINGAWRGAFTYYLTYHLRRDPAGSRGELIKRVRLSLSQHGYAQTPQLEIDATQRDRGFSEPAKALGKETLPRTMKGRA